MDRGQISWVSLWAPLLSEAVAACQLARRDSTRQLSAAASSIILARTSWDAFANELIEQRRLDDGTKELGIKRKIERLLEELKAEPPDFNNSSIWVDLIVISDLRNSLVHQKIAPREPGDSPRDILKKLTSIGNIEAIDETAPWEQQVFKQKVATWCCIRVGDAIKAIELIPARQFRPASFVCRQVDEILKPLAGA